jgi:uncharacterized SAM-binding protein YcdF (DUF218 family)
VQGAFQGATRRFGGQDRRNRQVTGDSFAQEVNGLGGRKTLIGPGSALDGFAHIFEQRIRGARNGAEYWHELFSYNVEIRITQRKAFAIVFVGITVAALLYLISLSIRIGRQSTGDEARNADMIIVMGAAEYSGRPSPVLRARLDHALELWKQHMAPLIMTTGGAGGDRIFTEAAVGRSYLMDRGVPATAIVTESEGETTMYSISAAAEIMARMDLHSCILVSDGYHIFRAKRMMQYRGIRVYGSPRQAAHQTGKREWPLYFRQAVAYALWKVGITV